ncbi:hypothetical protein EVAR_22150_1 [Eumeta japonica]|uniref:Uncharacterized protein n=1 Tax=Eumeta variegata TaxID=151549 RepID=A0A4C1VYB1_EUMVA|nr:hypothetical protein EVAR_22150_1 [Eumeta japonica]
MENLSKYVNKGSYLGVFGVQNVNENDEIARYQIVNGRVFNTYQDACRELQLLGDDSHWNLALADAALMSSPSVIRQLFAIILTTCFPAQSISSPYALEKLYFFGIIKNEPKLDGVASFNYGVPMATFQLHHQTLITIEYQSTRQDESNEPKLDGVASFNYGVPMATF